jgi:hypothetical protein
MDQNTQGTPQPGNTGGVGQAEMKREVLGFVGKVEGWLDEYMVTKAPFQIPMGGKEFLAKIAPYLIIISAVLTLPAILAFFGLTMFVAPLAMMTGSMGWGLFGIINLVTMVTTVVLNVMAVPGLFKRTHAGWKLLFYASLVSFIGGVLSPYPVGAIIGAIISWYILFQVKVLYKN